VHIFTYRGCVYGLTTGWTRYLRKPLRVKTHSAQDSTLNRLVIGCSWLLDWRLE